MTSSGGINNNNQGTVFNITPEGKLTTIYSFCIQTGCPDGQLPQYTQLIQATDGNLYGTTFQGGAYGSGTVFKITPSGTLTTLYSFCAQANCTDGFLPLSGLVQATNGRLYGTTVGNLFSSTCSGSGCGTIFSLSVGLVRFVETLPASGKVGRTIKILGNALTGTTAVDFNGSMAAFTVVSRTEIEATVPSGATTGLVTVTTPKGTLTSNEEFRVTP